jgi:Anti-sigma-K factor rskA, C-terminal
MTASDDERIAYLAGDAAESLRVDERAQLDELRETLRAQATWVEPDPGLEDRVLDAIAGEAQAHERPAPPPAARPDRSRPRWRMPRPAFAFGALAAATAVVVAVIVIANGNSAPAAPRFAMVITGTPLDPGAHGSATLTKTTSGWKIQMSASGLPHLSGLRFFYQAWLKNPQGILVPVGTFNDAKKVTLWSGVPVTKYRVLTVTEQPANGNPASSGQRVLVGRIRGDH